MRPLISDKNMRPKFAQIFTVDKTQEQIDTRQDYINNLDLNILRTVQRLLIRVNLYIEGVKTCYNYMGEKQRKLFK